MAATAKTKPAPKKTAAKKPAARKPRAATPPIAQPANPVTTLPLSDIAPSPLNPRKTFSEENLRELAESLFAQGQLQNIGVRKVSSKSPRYHTVYGERRYRAMQLLVSEGRWPKDAPVEVRIEDIDDATHLERAIMENERREEVHPLEQAEAYAKLAAIREAEAGDGGSVSGMIAASTGETQRNVQLYLQCARNLTPEMKEAWTRGLIPTRKLAIACARFAPDLQKDIIQALEWGDIRTEADLKEWLSETGYHSDAAIFALDDYVAAGGPSVEGPDGTGYQLLDKALFLKLQGAALEKQAKALTKQHGLTCPPAKFTQWYYKQDGIKIVDGAKTMPSDAYVLYGLDPNTADAWIHIVSPTAAKAVHKQGAGAGAPGTPGSSAEQSGSGPQPYARKNWIAGATVRTTAVRELIANSAEAAMALTIIALLPSRTDAYSAYLVDLREPNPCGDAKALAESAERLDHAAFNGIDGFVDHKGGWAVADREVATLALLSLPPRRLDELFACVIANLAVDLQSYNAAAGATGEAIALSKWAQARAATDNTAPLDGLLNTQTCTSADWFKAYTTSQLMAIADATPAADAMRAAGAPPNANKAYMVTQMADHCPQDWIPPEAQFLTATDMARAVDTLLNGGKS